MPHNSTRGGHAVVIACVPLPGVSVEAFFVSTGVVFLGEMDDKTQLLALLLAAKFRRPVPIIAGILVATILNHLFAGVVGTWVAAAGNWGKRGN